MILKGTFKKEQPQNEWQSRNFSFVHQHTQVYQELAFRFGTLWLGRGQYTLKPSHLQFPSFSAEYFLAQQVTRLKF